MRQLPPELAAIDGGDGAADAALIPGILFSSGELDLEWSSLRRALGAFADRSAQSGG